MKKWLSIVMLLFIMGCIPTTQQVQTLTNDVDTLMVSIDKVQEHIVQVNEAIKEKADESALDQAKAAWDTTKDFNPYYAYGSLALMIIGEGAALLNANKKNRGLEKGINRVKGEAEPELAKRIHDTMKIYT